MMVNDDEWGSMLNVWSLGCIHQVAITVCPICHWFGSHWVSALVAYSLLSHILGGDGFRDRRAGYRIPTCTDLNSICVAQTHDKKSGRLNF